MEYNVDFENKSFTQNKKISTIFSKQVFENSYLLDSFPDYESYIVDCIKNTFHILNMQKLLGPAKKVNDDYTFCNVCNMQIKQRQLKRTLQCNHEFHKKCIDKYIFKLYGNACPCCAKEIK